MDDRQFFRKVAEQAVLSVEEAADLTRATLQTMGDRLSSTETKRLALQLPEALRESLTPQDRVEKLGLDELLRRVSQRTGLNAKETEAGVRAVLTILAEAVDTATYEHIMAQLPGDIRTMAGVTG
jgi:uncharacterized protein (DUF2267 family)